LTLSRDFLGSSRLGFEDLPIVALELRLYLNAGDLCLAIVLQQSIEVKGAAYRRRLHFEVKELHLVSSWLLRDLSGRWRTVPVWGLRQPVDEGGKDCSRNDNRQQRPGEYPPGWYLEPGMVIFIAFNLLGAFVLRVLWIRRHSSLSWPAVHRHVAAGPVCRCRMC
jgi:hypothetical protein